MLTNTHTNLFRKCSNKNQERTLEKNTQVTIYNLHSDCSDATIYRLKEVASNLRRWLPKITRFYLNIAIKILNKTKMYSYN